MFLREITKKVWLIGQNEDMRMLLMVVLAETGGKVALTEEEIGSLSDLAYKVCCNLLEVLASYVRGNISSLAIDDFQVRSMDATGLSELRYISGWVIRVIFEKSRRYVDSNMYSESDEVGKSVDAHMLKVRLLKQNIIIPYDLLYKTTGCKPTLEYTEKRQFASRGLLHVVDEYFDFIIDLEQARVKYLTMGQFQTFGENFLFEIKKFIVGDLLFNLEHKWNSLFDRDASGITEGAVQIHGMFEEAVSLYIKVRAKQVLKDFRCCSEIKKTHAHRQMVMIRKDKKEKREAKVSMNDFANDKPEGKPDSHHKLVRNILQLGEAYIWTVYTVAELKRLCLAYDVTIPSSTKRKIEIAKLLLPTIKSSVQMKYPNQLDKLQVMPSNSQQGRRPLLGFRFQLVRD